MFRAQRGGREHEAESCAPDGCALAKLRAERQQNFLQTFLWNRQISPNFRLESPNFSKLFFGCFLEFQCVTGEKFGNSPLLQPGLRSMRQNANAVFAERDIAAGIVSVSRTDHDTAFGSPKRICPEFR
ncbi:MAG: hypothetical protein ACLPN5_21300 [Roseiarcus sp.]